MAVTASVRARWLREMFCDLECCADLMQVSPDIWRQIEEGGVPFPASRLEEFAHRFRAPVPFIVTGDLTGMWPELRDALVERHPELAARGQA